MIRSVKNEKMICSVEVINTNAFRVWADNLFKVSKFEKFKWMRRPRHFRLRLCRKNVSITQTKVYVDMMKLSTDICVDVMKVSTDLLLRRSLNVFDFVESFSRFLQFLIHGEQVFDASVHARMFAYKENDVFHLGKKKWVLLSFQVDLQK